jgi:hypothetical protein
MRKIPESVRRALIEELLEDEEFNKISEMRTNAITNLSDELERLGGDYKLIDTAVKASAEYYRFMVMFYIRIYMKILAYTM